MQPQAMTSQQYENHLHFISEREKEFDRQIRSGAFSPFLLHQVLGTFVLLIVPLVIRHKSVSHSRILRYGFHAIITALIFYTIQGARFLGPANGYILGLSMAWFFIWSTTILLANDAQKDFKRIEKEYVNGKDTLELDEAKRDGLFEVINHQPGLGTAVLSKEQDMGLDQRKAQRMYRWQSFPQHLSHRIEWVCDLVFNFRGPNWNWGLRSLASLPDAVIEDIAGKRPLSAQPKKQPKTSKLTYYEPSVRLQYAGRAFLRDLIALDFLTLVLVRDKYFWGFVDNPPPPPWPFDILAFSSILVRSYRLILSLTAIIFALDIIMSLSAFFLGIALAFPNFARAVTHQPLDEAWLYLPSFGPASAVLDQGLVGAWNVWWHQLFRHGFSECSRFVTDSLLPGDNQDVKKKNNDDESNDENENNNQKRNKKPTSVYKWTVRTIQVMLAFSLSGLVHAMGSYTAFAPTKPWNEFLFFFVQGIGVLAQSFFEMVIAPKITPSITTFCFRSSSTSTPPRWFVKATKLTCVMLWFYFTGPLIADDFARSGIYMFEPIPFSPLRGGLGLGVKGDQFFCWRSAWFEWWVGETWWQSGIRFL